MPSYEEEWTPVGLTAMPSGDVAVLHDGGAPVHHYYAPDYVSRLSPDLKERAWRFDVFFPEIQPIDKIRRRREEFRQWKFPILGQIRTLRMRGDAKSRALLAGSMFGSYGDRGYEATWAVDVAGLPGSRIVAVGRHNRNHKSTGDAWFDTTCDKGMFVKVFDKEMEELFSTNVPDAIPYALARKGSRCVVVGMTESANTPVKQPLQTKPAGGFDAYILVADFPN